MIFPEEASEDYLYWQRQDRKIVERINKLVQEIRREPLSGAVKPEQLEHALSGYRSRRIDYEHRMVYKTEGDSLFIAQLTYRY